MANFFVDMCSHGPDRLVRGTDLYDAYIHWADREKPNPRLTRKEFDDAVEANGFGYLKIGNKIFWRGLEFADIGVYLRIACKGSMGLGITILGPDFVEISTNAGPGTADQAVYLAAMKALNEIESRWKANRRLVVIRCNSPLLVSNMAMGCIVDDPVIRDLSVNLGEMVSRFSFVDFRLVDERTTICAAGLARDAIKGGEEIVRVNGDIVNQEQ